AHARAASPTREALESASAATHLRLASGARRSRPRHDPRPPRASADHEYADLPARDRTRFTRSRRAPPDRASARQDRASTAKRSAALPACRRTMRNGIADTFHITAKNSARRFAPRERRLLR